MEVGRRKKEEAVIAMVSAIKNVLTVLAVAIERPITKLLSMKESRKPQQQENLENLLMQLKIN